jgi:hypothetical protein
MMGKKELLEQYLEAIGSVEGEFTISDVKRAFETGFSMGQLIEKLKQFEETEDDEIN